ncbi:co-chaperone YbbN, partial [Pseudomonas sp. BGM005]|nr:co-chaperone YbbN [Pseudomonas sp. BG5]
MTDISPAALRGAVDLSTLRNRPSAPPAGAPAAGGAVADL